MNLKYERDLNDSFIVFKILNNQLEAHALKMMHYNKIEHLLSVSEKTENGETYLYYQITGKVSLGEWVKQNPIDYAFLKLIIESLLEVIQSAHHFLLSQECFILNQSTLFFDLEKRTCQYLYVPYANKPFNMQQQLKLLIQELFSVIHKQDEKAISFIHKLRMVMEDENFSVDAFNRILEFEESITSPSHPVDKEEEKLLTKPKRHLRQEPKEGIEGSTGINDKLTFAGLQIILGIILWVCVSQWLINEDNKYLVIIKVLLLLSTVGILELLMITKVLMQPKIETSAVEDLIQNPCLEMDEKINRGKWGWDNHKTERLKREQITGNKRAYWVDGGGVKVPIIKIPFSMGSLKEAVDFYIRDEAVESIHCKVIQEEGYYYLIDLKSKMGTMLNGHKISTEIRIMIYDGDEIELGNSSFKFRLI